MPKIKVSVATFNEIGAALEKQGLKLGENATSITLEKGTELEPPVDYRLATIRRDCADIASKSFDRADEPFVEYANKLYQFVLNGEVPEPKTNTLTIQKQSKKTEWK